MEEQRCYFCGRNAADYVEYVNSNCHVDIRVEVMDPDFEVSLRVFTDKNSVVNGEMWNIYKMGDPEVEAFQKQIADYITKNWQKNPLDQRNLSMKRGFRYEDVPNRPYPPDSMPRFQNAKMTKSQFDAMKKDVDAYKRKDMAALYESNDPVFFPMGYKNLGEFGDWDIDKYKSAKSCNYPFKPEIKQLLERHFKVYRSSPNVIKEIRNFQMELEIGIYEEAIKRIEKIFADQYAKKRSAIDSRNRKEEEDKLNALAELKNRPFVTHKMGKDGMLEICLCPVCEQFYSWASDRD